jgi:hypothetical protein
MLRAPRLFGSMRRWGAGVAGSPLACSRPRGRFTVMHRHIKVVMYTLNLSLQGAGLWCKGRGAPTSSGERANINHGEDDRQHTTRGQPSRRTHRALPSGAPFPDDHRPLPHALPIPPPTSSRAPPALQTPAVCWAAPRTDRSPLSTPHFFIPPGPRRRALSSPFAALPLLLPPRSSTPWPRSCVARAARWSASAS